MNESNSSNSTNNLYKRLIIRFILAVICIAIILFILPAFIRLLHPFIVALIIAAIVNSLVSKLNTKVSKINKKFSIPMRFTTLLLNLLVILAVLGLISFLSYIIIVEAIGFSHSIQQNWDSISLKVKGLQENFTWLIDILPAQLIDILEGFGDNLVTFIQNYSGSLIGSTVSTTASIIARTGNFFINTFTFLLALYFITSDYNRIGQLVQKYVSKGVRDNFILLKNSIVSAFGGYLKAQFILSLTAFIFMSLALVIYGQQYAFLIALFLAFLDLIPILGTIAVLAPWGIVEFFGGDINKGIFLILLGLIFFLFRRTIEPKVMGSQTGLHPLLALMSIYVGLKFSGLWGAILGPVALMLIISIVKSGIFDNAISDIKDLNNKMLKLLKTDKDIK